MISIEKGVAPLGQWGVDGNGTQVQMLSDQLPPCPLGWLDLLALTWINISSLLALIYWLIHQDAIATKMKVHLQAKKVLSLSNRFLMAVRQYLCPPTMWLLSI